MFQGALPSITTRQSFIDTIEVVDADDGSPIDLTDCAIQVALRAQGCGGSNGYSPSGRGGSFGSTQLLATTADGTVTIPEFGVILFGFTEAQCASLCPGQYAFAVTMTRSGETIQLILGSLSVLDGVVPQ